MDLYNHVFRDDIQVIKKIYPILERKAINSLTLFALRMASYECSKFLLKRQKNDISFNTYLLPVIISNNEKILDLFYNKYCQGSIKYYSEGLAIASICNKKISKAWFLNKGYDISKASIRTINIITIHEWLNCTYAKFKKIKEMWEEESNYIYLIPKEVLNEIFIFVR